MGLGFGTIIIIIIIIIPVSRRILYLSSRGSSNFPFHQAPLNLQIPSSGANVTSGSPSPVAPPASSASNTTPSNSQPVTSSGGQQGGQNKRKDEFGLEGLFKNTQDLSVMIYNRRTRGGGAGGGREGGGGGEGGQGEEGREDRA
jgi:hypothetical protein